MLPSGAGVRRQIAQARRHPRLGDTILSEGVRVEGAIADALRGAELVVFAVPTYAIGEVAGAARQWVPDAALLLSAAKGLERRSGLPPAAFLAGELALHASAERARVGVISGPNISEEILGGQHAATVVACFGHKAAMDARNLCTGPILRFYSAADIVGVQYGGALKNVIAIAAGISDGMGFGANAKAALVARGMVEIAALGVALGASQLTFWGLSGVGDCMVTCWSPLSRNRTLGELVGRGVPLPDALQQVGVAEGVDTAAAALRLAGDAGLELPITSAVASVLFDHVTVEAAVAALMAREPRDEVVEAPRAVR